MQHDKPTPLGRRQFLSSAAGTAALVVVGLSGCGTGNSASGRAGAYSGEVAVSHLTATIDGAPLIIAREMGYLSDVGLDVELVGFPGGSDTVRGMTQADMAFGVPSTVAVVTAFAKTSAEMRFISGNNNRATVNFLVPRRSPVTSLRQLHGKKVAVSRPGSLSTYFAEQMVRSVGLEPGIEVELLSVGGATDSWTAATQGLVDLAWSAPPFSTQLLQQGEARVVAHVSDFVESWADSMMTTTQPIVDEQPQMLRNLVLALDRSMTLLREDAQKAAEVYGPALELDVELARQALVDNSAGWSTKIPTAALPEISKAASALQGTDGDIDFNTLVDDRFLSAA